MSAALLGDPASVAALATSLRRRSAELERSALRLQAAHDDAAPGWTGRVAVGHRRRLDTATATARGALARMRDLADALEAYAEALGEAQQDLRRTTDEARVLGLGVEDGQVRVRWGISGEADHAADAERDEAAQRLARRLQRSSTLLERRRAALVRHAEDVAGWLP